MPAPKPPKTDAKRQRLDQLLHERGLAESRSQAQALIMAGHVLVNGAVVSKAGQLVYADATLELAAKPAYVSRGGDKLAPVLQTFGIQPAGWTALDCGVSTGGFTDCLLQLGVARVYAVDVAYGQVDWRLRQEPRVQLIERTNLRYLLENDQGVPAAVARGWCGNIDLVTLDLSFISLTKVLHVVQQLLKPGGALVALVKPQFELERGQVGKGGIVRDEKLQLAAVEKVAAACQALGLAVQASQPSPLKGGKGNQEYFLYARRS